MVALSEFYVFTFYMSFFPQHFGEIRGHSLYPMLLKAALVGAIVKHIHNALHLWVSSIRIVGLDVQIKNAPPKPATTTEEEA